jgi:hypothetical protein
VEPYRLPAAVNAAKVRLHVGSQAPVTAFIGRPVFESRNVAARPAQVGAYDGQRLHGDVSEWDCRLQDFDRAHDRATEAVTSLWRAVVGNVLRDRKPPISLGGFPHQLSHPG